MVANCSYAEAKRAYGQRCTGLEIDEIIALLAVLTKASWCSDEQDFPQFVFETNVSHNCVAIVDKSESAIPRPHAIAMSPDPETPFINPSKEPDDVVSRWIVHFLLVQDDSEA
jgi:hypothetical protein